MAAVGPYQCALITGASSGIGAEFARQLAPVSKELVLVARRVDLLNALSSEIEGQFNDIKVHCIQADLTEGQDFEDLVSSIQSAGLYPDLLINNAGMGDYGEFKSADWAKVETMIRLNMEVLTRLTHCMLPSMINARSGSIINVSSLASVLPIPDFAVYAASKAYVTSFSEALRIELADQGIKVMALCPGPVHTGFGEVAQRGSASNVTPGGEIVYVECKQVVKEAINAIEKGKARHYPGKIIGLMATLFHLLPVTLIRKLMQRRPRRKSQS